MTDTDTAELCVHVGAADTVSVGVMRDSGCSDQGLARWSAACEVVAAALAEVGCAPDSVNGHRAGSDFVGPTLLWVGPASRLPRWEVLTKAMAVAGVGDLAVADERWWRSACGELPCTCRR